MNETQERKKIIILGGTGYIGTFLHEKLVKTFDVQSLGIDDFNKYKFEDAHVLINLAAHSSVALCELFPKTADPSICHFHRQAMNHPSLLLHDHWGEPKDYGVESHQGSNL